MIWTDAVSVFSFGRVKAHLLKSEYWEYICFGSQPLFLSILLVFLFFFFLLHPTLADGFVGRSVSRTG